MKGVNEVSRLAVHVVPDADLNGAGSSNKGEDNFTKAGIVKGTEAYWLAASYYTP